MDYDIVIAGGGPAGLTAAMTAARDGFSVLLVETKEHVARYTRPCCSMWLLEPGFHNEGWTFQDGHIFFHRNDFSIPYTGNIVDLTRSVRISSRGQAMVMGKKLTPIGKVINKQTLLDGLLECAGEAGVAIRPKTTCLAVEEISGGIKARMRHNNVTEWVTGKYFFAADGVDSMAVASMGLNRERKMFIRTPVLYYYFADVHTPYTNAWVQFIGDGFNGVSGSMLHKPDRDGFSNVFEVGALPPSGSGIGLKEAMQRLLSHPVLKDWFSGARLIKKMGCRWTCWTPIAKPAQGRFIIVGDSASFQEVENQGAVMCGFRAAKAVAATEGGADGFAQYNRFWQESFEFNDPEILKETWKAFIFRFLGQENIDYIISLSQGTMLDGYVNHFNSGKIIFDFVKEHLKEIEEDRPELAAKIRQFETFNMNDHMLGDVQSAAPAS